MKHALLVAFALPCLSLLAVDSDREFSLPPPNPISTPLLVVTHASTRWDRSKTAKAGIDRAITAYEKQEGAAIVFLAETDYERNDDGSYSNRRTAGWYTELKKPSLNLMSHGGEHILTFDYPEVTMVGGNFGLCQTTSLFDLIAGYKGKDTLTLRLPLDAVFSGLGGRATTLQEDLAVLGSDRMDSFLVYTLSDFPTVVAKLGVHLKVFRDERFIGETGTGKKQVHVRFQTGQ